MSKGKSQALQDYESVRELLALLKEHQSPGREELMVALGQVAEMENRLAEAVAELKAIREDLTQMPRQPLKTALQESVIGLQDRLPALRDSLTQLKAGIIEGCKKALVDFRARGVMALDNVSRFFHFKSVLEAVRSSINACIRIDERAIAKIETMSAEYHEAGRHLKNMGRAAMGKEGIREARPTGWLAKTIQAPYRAELACFMGAKSNLDKAIASFDRLERSAQKPPSILKAMQKHKETIGPHKEKKASALSHDGR